MAQSRPVRAALLIGVVLLCCGLLGTLRATGLPRGARAAEAPAATAGQSWHDAVSLSFQYGPIATGPVLRSLVEAGKLTADSGTAAATAPAPLPCPTNPTDPRPSGPIHKTMGTQPGHCLQISGAGVGANEIVTAVLFDHYLKQIVPLGPPVKTDDNGAFVMPAVALPSLLGQKMVYVQVTCAPLGASAARPSLTMLRQFTVKGP